MSVVLGILGLLMIVVGILGATSSANDSSKMSELRAGGGSIERGEMIGAVTVVEKTAPGLPKRTSYCPRYSYAGSDGVKRTITDRDGCESAAGRLSGRTVNILVDTNDPSVAFIDEHESSVGRTSFAIFAWSTLVIGIGLVLGAPIIAFRSRKTRPPRSAALPRH